MKFSTFWEIYLNQEWQSVSSLLGFVSSCLLRKVLRTHSDSAFRIAMMNLWCLLWTKGWGVAAPVLVSRRQTWVWRVQFLGRFCFQEWHRVRSEQGVRLRWGRQGWYERVDQKKHAYHLGACLKWRFPGSTPDPLIPTLHLNNIPTDLYAWIL